MAFFFWPQRPKRKPPETAKKDNREFLGSVGVQRVSMRATQAKYLLVANSKGGSGKSTLAINLASVYANMGFKTALMDYDSQGSSTEWLDSRPADRSLIHGVIAHRDQPGYTRSWTLSIPRECQRVIIDTPAKLGGFELTRLMQRAHIILVPVLPSPIDISASAEFIGDILLSSEFQNSGQKKQIAVIPNRVRPNTLIYQKLHRFLESLQLPLLDPLRDTDIYLRSYEYGIGSHEMMEAKIEQRQWEGICNWLEESLSWQQRCSDEREQRNFDDDVADDFQQEQPISAIPSSERALPGVIKPVDS